MRLIRLGLALATLLVVAAPYATHAQVIDDLSVRYSSMVIQRTRMATPTPHPAMYRHNVELALGRGFWTIGLHVQATNHAAFTDDTRGFPGVPEQGAMLTAGREVWLSYRTRLEGFARVGLPTGTDHGQPLYATDTNLQVNLVTFAPEGRGFFKGQPFFPSGYVGGIVNHFGRVQGIGGTGVWWRKVGTYLTAFYAFNGVADPATPGHRADRAFGMLRNSGVSFSLSYDVGPFTLDARRNVPLRNGSHDITVTLQYRTAFGPAW